MLSAQHGRGRGVPSIYPQNKPVREDFCDIHFTGEGLETPRREGPCLGSHSQPVADLGLSLPGLSDAHVATIHSFNQEHLCSARPRIQWAVGEAELLMGAHDPLAHGQHRQLPPCEAKAGIQERPTLGPPAPSSGYFCSSCSYKGATSPRAAAHTGGFLRTSDLAFNYWEVTVDLHSNTYPANC